MSVSVSPISNRVYDRSTQMFLQQFQKYSPSTPLRNEIISIPAESNAAFSGQFSITVREQPMFIHQCILELQANAIVGMTTNPRYTPANFWISRCDVLIGGQLVQSISGEELHVLTNAFWDDADRLSMNKQTGHYAVISQRVAMAATTSKYFVNLKSFIDQIHYPLLTPQHQLQFKITLESLANSTVAGSGTATNTGVVSCNALLRVSRIPTETAAALLNEMSLKPWTNLYHKGSFLSTTINVTSAATSVRVLLTNFTGNISHMFFTLRSTASLPKDGFFTYQPITSFAILSSDGSNQVGGSQITHSVALDTLAREWTLSSFCTENDTTLTTVYSNLFAYSNVYFYTWSNDVISAVKTGSQLGSKKFYGQEMLELYVPTTGTYQLNVYAYQEAALIQSNTGVTLSAF